MSGMFFSGHSVYTIDIARICVSVKHNMLHFCHKTLSEWCCYQAEEARLQALETEVAAARARRYSFNSAWPSLTGALVACHVSPCSIPSSVTQCIVTSSVVTSRGRRVSASICRSPVPQQHVGRRQALRRRGRPVAALLIARPAEDRRLS